MKSFPSSLLLSLRIDRDNLDLGVFMSHSFQQYLHSVTVFYGLPKPTENNILNFLTVLFYFTVHTLTSQFLFFFSNTISEVCKDLCLLGQMDRITPPIGDDGIGFYFSCQLRDGITTERHIQKTELLERQKCEAPPTLLRIRD